MNVNFGRDLTTGSIPKHLLYISIPMLIANFLQVLYNLVDAMWVGNQVGREALGAIGVSFSVTFILIGISSGATIATTILISQYFGAKDYEMVHRVVNNSFSVSLILSILMSSLGIIFRNDILRWMGTPTEIYPLASSYLKIILAGYIFTYFSFLVTSILRGIGDSITPLIFMAIGVIINIILDPFLIMGIGPFPQLGVEGAAYASVISTIIAFLIGLIYLNKKNHIIAFNPKNLILDKGLTAMLFKIGIPSMIQQTFVSIGMVFILTFVNVFGESATASYAATGRIDSIAFMPALSLGMAVSILTGQNLGAEKPERVKEIFKWGVIMTSVITVVISLFAVSMPSVLLGMFGLKNDLAVLNIGIEYLRIVGASYILFAIMFISNGIINGAGHTLITMLFTLISLWFIRVPLANKLSSTTLGLRGIWISMSISFAIALSMSLIYYFSGRWKKVVLKK
ncbi:UNVERIFIED_CONTAM: putative MATE family efflux protein [Acetivibrio alkalicellulosi]